MDSFIPVRYLPYLLTESFFFVSVTASFCVLLYAEMVIG